MAAPKPRTTRSRSHRDVPDLEKMDAAYSWDALEWTKIEPVTRSVSRVNLDCLLETEQVIAEGYGVVLVNTDEAGTLFVTNFRLLFLSEGTMDVISLGTIPLATIDKFNKIVVKSNAVSRQSEKSSPSRRLLQVIGKDMRIIVFGFRPRTKQSHSLWLAPLATRKSGARPCGTNLLLP